MLKRSLGKLASEFPGVAYISGAGSGIGAATAQAFVRAGCSRVFLTDLNPSTLERTTKSLQQLSSDVRVETAAGDISSRHFIDEIFDKLHSDFGRLDYAVNCAGMIGRGKSTSESSVEEFDKVTDVNYRGVWMCSRRQLQMMKEQPLLEQGQEDQRRRQRGSIVNIASQLGIVGRPKSSAYCATKSAIIGLTRCDAIDHSENLIRINAVCPGFIDTPLVHPLTEESKKYIAISPMNRVGTPEEVADVVVFLSGEKASFVQGAAWTVDGGYTIN